MTNGNYNINETILKSLDGKKAVISSSGLVVEGSMEGTGVLKWNDSYGLSLLVPLRWNNVKFLDDFNVLLRESSLRWSEKDEIYKATEELIKKNSVQAANIYPWSIQNMEVQTEDKTADIQRVDITFRDGSKTAIRIRK